MKTMEPKGILMNRGKPFESDARHGRQTIAYAVKVVGLARYEVQ